MSRSISDNFATRDVLVSSILCGCMHVCVRFTQKVADLHETYRLCFSLEAVMSRQVMCPRG